MRMLKSFHPKTFDAFAIAAPLTIIFPLSLIISAQEFVIVTVSLLFLLRSWQISDFSWIRRPWLLALALLWAFALIRTTIDHPTASGFLMALHWIHYGVFAAALSEWILPHTRSRHLLILSSLATVMFFSLDCLIQYEIGRDILFRPLWKGRATSVFHKPGVGSEIAWLYLPGLFWLWSEKRRWTTGVSAAICFAAILTSGDRMALITFLGAGIIGFTLMPTLRKPLVILLPALIAITAAIFAFNPKIEQRFIEKTMTSLESFHTSDYGVVYDSAFAIINNYPVFGVGVGKYQQVCSSPAYGSEYVGPAPYARCLGHPHNLMLFWLAQTGAIGLAFYCGFIIVVISTLAQSWKRSTKDMFFYAVAAELLFRFFPFNTSTSFFSSWSTGPLFLMLGWALAYQRASTKENSVKTIKPLAKTNALVTI